jgi:hypothetical protein
MSLRQCLRCCRMKREVKRRGICHECRRLVPDWRDPQSLVGQKPQPPASRLVRPSSAVRKSGNHLPPPEPVPCRFVTIIGSHARHGESASDWTLGFEGEVSLQQRRERISDLLKRFARVRVFVAKQLVDEFPARAVQLPAPDVKVSSEPPSRSELAERVVSQIVSVPRPRAAGAPRLIKRVLVKTMNQPTNPSPPVEERPDKRVVGPYLEEPDY